MTDPTPEMAAMSKRLSLRLWPGEDGEYPMERRIAEEAALAAIIETTEAAAKLLEPYADSYAEMARISTDSRVDCRSVEADIKYNMIAALRAYDHIKPENG